jgi:hypothetical protein
MRLSMKCPPARRCLPGLLALIGCLAVLGACGYRLAVQPGSRFAADDVRVDLRPFLNATTTSDAGVVLAASLREEMRRSGFRGIFERPSADYSVDGTVREIRISVVSHGADGRALEHRLDLFIDIRVVEVVRGRLLWKEEGLAESVSFFAGSDYQYTESNRRLAFEEASRRLARRIGQTLRVIL